MNATTNAPVSNAPALSYKELQAKLKELRTQGHTLTCKLNAKHDVLLQEYNRIVEELEAQAQQALDDTALLLSQDTATQLTLEELSYPFNSNTVTVENNVEYRTAALPAMSSAVAPSWLTKQHKLYWIDGVDYLPFELEQLLDGSSCELACTVGVSTPLPAPTAPSPVANKPSAWDKYLSSQDVTVQQAARNGVEILRCAKAFGQGFLAGLKRH